MRSSVLSTITDIHYWGDLSDKQESMNELSPMDTSFKQARLKKRKRRKVLVFSGGVDSDSFSIDEYDYLVVSEMMTTVLKSGAVIDCIKIQRQLQKIVEIRENDDERRVFHLGVPTAIRTIPTSVGTLDHLTHLDLRRSHIESLPPSIGQLKNLRELHLSRTLKELPEEIGDLTSLTKLNGSMSSKILLLPKSIGRLRNLQDLYLSWTFLKLPEEIGDLTSLKILNLRYNNTAVLPTSIGRLKNIVTLDLCCNTSNAPLPHEIGDLASLENLNLSRSRITSLPSSIGGLKNLQDLDLSYTVNLKKLPDAIGKLTNLKRLDLHESGVTILPGSIGELKSLLHLNLDGTLLLDIWGKSPRDFLLQLAKRCPFLGTIGTKKGALNRTEQHELGFALACNRARFRIPQRTGDTAKLWPNVLRNAERAFLWYPEKYSYRLYFTPVASPVAIQTQDAIYQLLIHGRESLVGILVNRRTKRLPGLQTTRTTSESTEVSHLVANNVSMSHPNLISIS